LLSRVAPNYWLANGVKRLLARRCAFQHKIHPYPRPRRMIRLTRYHAASTNSGPTDSRFRPPGSKLHMAPGGNDEGSSLAAVYETFKFLASCELTQFLISKPNCVQAGIRQARTLSVTGSNLLMFSGKRGIRRVHHNAPHLAASWVQLSIFTKLDIGNSWANSLIVQRKTVSCSFHRPVKLPPIRF
jgi:hypothetical protein